MESQCFHEQHISMEIRSFPNFRPIDPKKLIIGLLLTVLNTPVRDVYTAPTLDKVKLNLHRIIHPDSEVPILVGTNGTL